MEFGGLLPAEKPLKSAQTRRELNQNGMQKITQKRGQRMAE